MLTTKQFDRIKVGDIVLFNGRPRTVRQLHRYETRYGVRRSIGFSILHRSWTGRIHTLYGYHDIKHALAMPRKQRSRREVCRAEEDALLASGFDVQAGIEYELAENARLTKAGFGEDRATVALMKQVERKFKRRKPR